MEIKSQQMQMDLRKDSDLHMCSEPPEPHAGFTMSRGPRRARLVALITKPRSRNKSCPMSEASFTWRTPLQVASQHWAPSAHSCATATGFAPEHNNDSVFHPSSSGYLAPNSKPSAGCTCDSELSSQKPCVYRARGSRELRVQSPAAPCYSQQNARWPTELVMNPPAAGGLGWDNVWDNAKGYSAVTEESWCIERKFEANRF